MITFIDTDIDITQNKIIYWFDVNGQKFGLKNHEGFECIVNPNGDTLKIDSEQFIIDLLDARTLAQAETKGEA